MKTLISYLNESKDKSIYATGFQPKFDSEKKIFIIVKPGFLDLANQIIDKYKESGFELFETRTTRLTINQARSLYKMHKKEDWYNDLCKYMVSDISMGITFKYGCSTKEAFKKCAELKDEIREKYGEDDKRNVMHSSDNHSNMERESSFYF